MRANQQEWAARIQQWRASGQTARDFARAHGINHNTLTHWAWRLGGDKGPAARQQKRTRHRRGEQPAFVEVMSQSVADGCFELELAGGRRLRIPACFQAESLAQLLKVLEQQR